MSEKKTKRRSAQKPGLIKRTVKGTIKFIWGVFSYLKTLFFSGLFTILPIILTIFIIATSYDFISRWLKPLKNLKASRLQEITFLKTVPGLPRTIRYLQSIAGIEVIIIILLLLILGFLLRLVFIKPIVNWFERMIKKIPFIRSVYSSAKIVVNFFYIPTKKKKVALIQFPRKGFYTIGFVLEPATDNFQKLIPKEQLKPGQTYYKVFMPNSPTPATGHFFILPEDEIIQTNITFDEAIRSVVSCGLITPRSIYRQFKETKK